MQMATREIGKNTASGWPALWLAIVGAVALIALAFPAFLSGMVFFIVVWALVVVFWAIMIGGFYTLQPNQAAVLVLFGRYSGTDRTSGFRWANPFLTKIKLSQRARNLNMQTIKVNDQRGNPVEIAAVVVWRVEDTAQATFDVENFDQFVSVQSEAALRHLASAYPYDTTEEHVLSLRGSMDEVSVALQKELQDRVSKAGVVIEDARLSHLAYSAEIAGAMLQRQQAEAIVAARTRIVDGAVGIVEMALQKLQQHELVKLDDERKAAMVNNLLVVLCGDKTAHPVIHAGSLYN
ncbi:MAG: SPFH domain-containing protein [Planctomycetes bacterium]|nr:SPFH domain-containing protein [Planctomycetota bacterium]